MIKSQSWPAAGMLLVGVLHSYLYSWGSSQQFTVCIASKTIIVYNAYLIVSFSNVTQLNIELFF